MIYLLCANRREYCLQNENGINHVVLLSSHDDIAWKENTATRHLILSIVFQFDSSLLFCSVVRKLNIHKYISPSHEFILSPAFS